MKLEFLSFDFDKFAHEMQDLKDKKGFDYLVTIVGEDFGKEEGLGCVYILENTTTHERCSVKMIARQQICGDVAIWKVRCWHISPPFLISGRLLTCWSVRSMISMVLYS